MKSVQDYYAEMANNYSEMYYPNGGNDPEYGYVGDHIRLQIVMRRLAMREGIERVFEVGCGDGYVLDLLARAGYLVSGCDVVPNMVHQVPSHFTAFVGDLSDATTLASAMASSPYQAILCLGVMPHMTDDRRALQNLRMLGRPGTVYFIEVRNALFSLFTMNRYTYEFMVDDLLGPAAQFVRDQVGYSLVNRLKMDAPPPEPTLRRFHNPLTLPDLLADCGFGTPKFHYYHAHATLPWLGDHSDPAIKAEMLKLEQPNDWRSMFLCSACIVEVEAV